MEITNHDIFKHYGASVLIYGLILVFLTFCPVFNSTINSPVINYVVILFVYYMLYVIFALPIFMKFRPVSIKNSRNLAIFNYFKRQFKKGLNAQEKINSFTPTEFEKDSMLILLIKAFFGCYCLNILCTKYIPSLGYDFDFLKEMFHQAYIYTQNSGIVGGILQYIDDTNDMFVNLMMLVVTVVYAISYLTETDLFKNRIKTVDSTPLGLLSCFMCYYPFVTLTDAFFPGRAGGDIDIPNLYIRISLAILMILINLIVLISVLRLGTKVGNLTNRGIVTQFPYSVVRHPNYSMQMILLIVFLVTAWFTGTDPIFAKIIMTFGIFAWVGIYYIRALTEERNLLQDNDYIEYCQKVKYKFIPKII